MQGREMCDNSGINVCVDTLKMTLPGMGTCERCGTLDDPLNANCMEQSGIGTEMMVEFVTNREMSSTGFEILANCVDPAFDQNGLGIGKKRQAQQCTSPTDTGPRPFEPVPRVSYTSAKTIL